MPREDLDPANRMLSDALGVSFRILKLIMLVLVVLYFMSGWFSVGQSERGLIVRFGRILGVNKGNTDAAVLTPNWYWSWPYPFDRFETVNTQQRSIDIDFMFQMTSEEEVKGISGYKYDSLTPEQDNYLITGDVNILHASVQVRYKITDAVAYLTNVKPMFSPKADVREREASFHYPEYVLLEDIVRNAVIETAAARDALAIRGDAQDEFLDEVSLCATRKIDALTAAGCPIGITIDPDGGIIAPKAHAVEAILPPRQVQEVFDLVTVTGSQKEALITNAKAQSQDLLLRTAGPQNDIVAEAIDKEYELMLALTIAQNTGDTAAIAAARTALAAQRAETESLLKTMSGEVKRIISQAESVKDGIINDAKGDFDQFMAVLPEYEQNPLIFRTRRLSDMYANAMRDSDIAKLFVPPGAKEYRLQIKTEKAQAREESQQQKDDAFSTRPKPRKSGI